MLRLLKPPHLKQTVKFYFFIFWKLFKTQIQNTEIEGLRSQAPKTKLENDKKKKKQNSWPHYILVVAHYCHDRLHKEVFFNDKLEMWADLLETVCTVNIS